jgi:hypothetical protein
VFTLFALLLFSPLPAMAQVNTADVVGTVTDTSGAVVPGANITLKNTATGIARTMQTQADGDYVFNLMQVGTYDVTIEAKGFKTMVTKGLALYAGDRARVDGKLEVGTASESVSVEADIAPALHTDSSSVGNTIVTKSVADLPLNGRNVYNLVQLSAGTTEGALNAVGSGTSISDRRLTSSYSVNGQNDFFNNNMIDGMDNNERAAGTVGVKPSIDAIQEVKVSTNLYTAEVSRSVGGVMDTITKSGGNNFHGSAFEYLRNDILDARNYFTRVGKAAKPELRQNQFGGSIGGPILKNKTFFFGDYEGFRQVYGQNTYNDTVPSLANEQAVAAAAVGSTVTLTDLNAVTTANPTGTYTATVTALGKNLMSLYPAPQTTATTNNFVYSPSRTQFSHVADVRIDEHFSDKDSMFGRYSYNNVATFTPGLMPPATIGSATYWSGNVGGLYAGPTSQVPQNLGLDYVHVYRPTLLLELKASYLRFTNLTTSINPTGAAASLGFDSCTLGTGYCINSGLGGSAAGLPSIGVQNYAGLGDGMFVPQFVFDNMFQYMGSLTWNKGAHNVKGGVNLIRRQFTRNQSQSGRGSYAINNDIVNADSLANMVQGVASNVQQQSTVAVPHTRSWEPGAYIQDDWRVNSRLTLNLGVRYDIFGSLTDAHGYISNFDAATGLIVSPDLLGANHSGPSADVPTDYSNVAPRLGFSASLPYKLVVRGGFGLSYFSGVIGNAAHMINAPFLYGISCGAIPYNLTCPAAMDYPGSTFGIKMSAGIPVPYMNSSTATSPIIGAEIDGDDNNMKSGRIAQFSLQVEKEFGSNVLSLGYVGNQGRHLPVVPDINQPTVKPTGSAWGVYSNLPNTSIYMWESASTSNYNSLQTTLQRRFGSGLTANVNYTYAHALNNGSPQGEGGSRPVECVRAGCQMDSGNGTAVTVNGFKQYDYGNADLDVRHRVGAMVNYELPFGKSMTGPLAYVIKGWNANTVVAWRTGLHTSITANGATDVAGIPGFRGADAPNQIGNPMVLAAGASCTAGGHPYSSIASLGSLTPGGNIQYLNPCAFHEQASGLLGNVQRNSIAGPHYEHWDMALSKDFPVHDALSLQFRAEAFNLTNTPSFSFPNVSMGNAAFGQLSATSAGATPRQMQFALRLTF